MLLAEEFALLAIQPDDGRLPLGKKAYVQLGLAALLLAELAQLGRISVAPATGWRGKLEKRERDVAVIDDSSTGDELLDDTLRAVRERGPSLGRVVQRLGRATGGVWDRVTDRLEAGGMIDEEEDPLLWVIPRSRHTVLPEGHRAEELERLRQAALGVEPIESRDALLLAMVGNCQLLELLIPERRDRGRAKARIQQAEKEAPYGPLVKSIVDAQAAAVTVVVVSSAASSA